MKGIKISVGIMTLGLLSACASQPPKPTYVSPTQYQSLDCQALQAEYNRLQHYLEQGVEPEKRKGMGVGVGIGGGIGSGGGWGIGPSISVNMGQSSNTKRTETARLLGEQEAIVQAAIYKRCPILVKNKTKSS